jgi:hypothetical protein
MPASGIVVEERSRMGIGAGGWGTIDRSVPDVERRSDDVVAGCGSGGGWTVKMGGSGATVGAGVAVNIVARTASAISATCAAVLTTSPPVRR